MEVWRRSPLRSELLRQSYSFCSYSLADPARGVDGDKEKAMSYTREQIRIRLDELASNMALFYKRGCINYRGKTSDTKEYYSEVISEWLLERLDLLNQVKPITRQSSYWVDGHDGIPDNPNSIRKEELIAMAMKRQGTLPLVGQVLDYQTPLKSVQKDKAGKIDLLTYDDKTLRILELKEPDSKETMLRCVLEGYTYLKTVDRDKLISDFIRDSGVNIPAGTALEACPFVFHGGFQWKEMHQDRPHLKRLMEALNSKPYYVVEEKGVYSVTEE